MWIWRKRAGTQGSAGPEGYLVLRVKALRDLGRAACHCDARLMDMSHNSITTL